MAHTEHGSDYASREQIVYAGLLDAGMKLGFVLLVVTFMLYVFGVITPHVPLEEITHYWSMRAPDYLAAADVPIGWGWLGLAGTGDFLNFVPIAFLSAVTIICYIRVLPILQANGDRPYVVIAALEILVLVLAASGILAAGH
ncbi:hypothetical protein TspCOW1_04230 [Thiohalobacter sp. COW1]|uniref:DUF1634 domain-containing protein n=1 Tax=Thiohalobacter thiocyanaticus TaxID=585455 RepID=A0A1Z4VSI5_9GAMM|nr:MULTISPECIES: hypothetical protein [Thiohalobacter]BAZ94597.1 uncharacterized protein FOKN1_2220 [Thiohalobacter thiocyanaticus]BCO30320.1 hypothetical protein TspCOW1_04230 [Thiohalobacter sp. COW1]